MGPQSLLALLLLLLLSHCPFFSEEQSIGDEGEPRVKLCGRDFVRAVVFTCGGSRYRRISPETTAASGDNTRTPQIGFLKITNDKGQENKNLMSVSDPTVKQLQSLNQPAGQQPLKDLSTLYIESAPLSDNFIEYIRQVEDAARKRRRETEPNNLKNLNNFPWDKYPRRKRDVDLQDRLSLICCVLGCTQEILNRLC
ncbi:uncharacterized protein LOC103277661 [Anolis carolinensis]|uniref:uncharacterized protein LOC103277661 n=1 Tax=Anolis carolinensis TaxID=28377 RepID=UPI002F2B2660